MRLIDKHCGDLSQEELRLNGVKTQSGGRVIETYKYSKLAVANQEALSIFSMASAADLLTLGAGSLSA